MKFYKTNKTKQRGIALLLAVLMLFTASPFALAQADEADFGLYVGEGYAPVFVEEGQGADVTLEDYVWVPAEVEEGQAEPMEAVDQPTPVVVDIGTAVELLAFLDGTLQRPDGSLAMNYDHFRLTNNIVIANGTGPGQMHRPATGTVTAGAARTQLDSRRMGRPASAALGGAFTGIFDGQDYTIENIVLRPRRLVDGETPSTITAANLATSTMPYMNDFGFIRLIGDGAVIRNVTFLDARFYDGGRNHNIGTTSRNHDNAFSTTSIGGGATNATAQLAGGAGGTAENATGPAQNGTAGNQPTHRGIVAGRILPNAVVTFDNVNIGEAITGNGQTAGARGGTNQISHSRHIGLWEGRLGGIVGTIGQGSTVNVINSDISVNLRQEALGSQNRLGGIVGENLGAALNLVNVNVHAVMWESHWGATVPFNTRYGGGIVGRNFGALTIGNGTNPNRNTVHVEAHRAGQPPNWPVTGGTAGSLGGSFSNIANGHWGHFGSVGRVVGVSSGPVNVSDMNLSGHIQGRNDVGGVAGAVTSALTLSNMTISGAIGGTQTSIGTGTSNRNTTPARPTNAGGVVGRVTGPTLISNVHVSGNIYGGRGDGNNLGVGGLVGNAMASVTIYDSSYSNGQLRGHSNAGGLVGRVGGTVSIYNSHTAATATMIGGQENVNSRTHGRGGIVGRVTNTGAVFMDGVTNNLAPHILRGHVGGIVGRMQGGEVTIRNTVNNALIAHGFTGTGTGITARRDSEHSVGGFVGDAHNARIVIENSYNHGEVRGQGRERGIGGFVGHVGGANSSVRLENVENTAEVRRTQRPRGHVGGLIGWARGSVEIIDSQNLGDVITTAGSGINRISTMGGLVSRADRNLTIINSENHGDVASNMNRTMRGLGGLVGYARGRVEITDSANWGDTASSTTTASRSTRVESNQGGIIGRSDMAGATAATRQTILTNVQNHGNIGTTGSVGGITIGGNNLNHSVGGVIGRTINRASNRYTFTNVENHGTIRGRSYVGGMIGFNDSLNVHIAQSANHGTVTAGRTATDARGHMGGFVGRTARANFRITESMNAGPIQTLTTSGNMGTSASRLRTGSTAGFVGIITAGDVTIRESFNAGAIFGVDRNTAGFVGLSRGSGALTIADSYNIGTVTSRISTVDNAAAQQRRQRSGNGILGFREGGNVIIERVYNAGRVQGRPIYGSPAIAPGGTIGTYAQFRNVYWDMTTHTGVDQTILRGTIAGVTTDILARGILPGFTSAPWLYGTVRVEDGVATVFDNTYPYLAWQTGGQLEELFFLEVRDPDDAHRAVMDKDGTGMRNTRFLVPANYVGATRYFLPYGQPQHFAPIETTVSYISFERDGLMSLGVISPNFVVGFDIEDRTGVAVMAVDYFDGEPIFWAEFMVDDVPTASIAGIIIVDGLKDPVTLVREERFVEVSAFGYYDADRLITFELYEEVDGKLVEIPMYRADIEHVRVEIRNSEYPAHAVLAGSTLTQARPTGRPDAPWGPNNIEASQPGAVATRYFYLDAVRWRDILGAGAPDFMPAQHMVSFGDFEQVENPSRENPHVLRIYLDDIRLPVLALHVVWEEELDHDEPDNETAENPITRPINHGGATSVSTVSLRNPEGVLASQTPVADRTNPTRGNATNIWNVRNTLESTEIQVGATGFRTSEWMTIEDLLEFNDEGDRTANITAILEREITLHVNVMQQVLVGFDAQGEPIINSERIPNANLFHEHSGLEETRTITANTTGVNQFTVTNTINGELIRATAEGFGEGFHTVSWMEDIAINGNTGTATGTVTIYLAPYRRNEVVFTTNDPLKGSVSMTVNGTAPADPWVEVLQGETLVQVPGLAVAVEVYEGNRFTHWSSLAFPGQRFTTEELFSLQITQPTFFVAHFSAIPPFAVNMHIYGDEVNGELNYDGDIITIAVTPGVPREEWVDQEALEEALKVGHIYGAVGVQGYAFWGWFSDETLDNSGRPLRYGYRRPAVGDTCEFEAILLAIEEVDPEDLEAMEALFGDLSTGEIDLFSIWSLWGDADDDDNVDAADVLVIQQHILNENARRFNEMMGMDILPIPFPDLQINLQAAHVTQIGEVDAGDVLAIQQYILNENARRFNEMMGMDILPIPFPGLVLGYNPNAS